MSNLMYKFKEWVEKYMNEKQYGKIYCYINNKNNYVNFNNREEAKKWGEEYYSKWAAKYKEVMALAKNIIKTSCCTDVVERYCGYTYRQINQFLRNKVDNDNNLYREMSDVLAMVLSSAPRIPCDVVLYRMVNDYFIKELISNNKKYFPTPVKEKGFMSTSLLKNIATEKESYASEKNLLKIFVPKDTIGIYVNSVTEREEMEMLLAPNMYLELAAYPYKDQETGKNIFECKLTSYISI